MTHGPESFSETEQAALDQLSKYIIATRESRSEKVQACMDALEQTDEATRLVARISIEHFIADEEPGKILADPFLRVRAYREAPGMYMAFKDLFEKLVDTGEFTTVHALRDGAVTLGFKKEAGQIAAEFLFQWVAARNPESTAERHVNEYGLRSGRMSKRFNTFNLLFHEIILQEYIEEIDREITPRTDIDPIIYLTATDDWERATALMTPTQRRKLDS